MTNKIVSVISEIAGAGLTNWDARPFLEKVAEIVPSIIYVYNQQTQSNEYSNRGIGESLGYSPAEVQAMGAELMARLSHPEDLPKILAYLGEIRAMKDGEVAMLEYRMRRKEGGWVWLLAYDTVFERDDSGAVLRHVGVATDITTQKEAEAALERVNEELSEMAYVITHDMKSPINNIMGLCSILEGMPEIQGGEGVELVSMIGRSCRQAADKIEEFFNVIQASRLESELVDLDLAPAVALVRDKFATIIQDNDAVLVEDFEHAPQVRSAKIQLQSILENVIGNALKHRAPDRSPHIILRSSTLPNGMTRVTVQDNGVGIDTKRDGKRIFKLFQRVNLKVPGSGVGLYLVHQMMTRSGGSVEIRGEPGKGATVELYFAGRETTDEERLSSND
ncbi:MAG: PAS domain-containing sensor histidine kinase [Myxococcota bacterium]